MATQKDITDSIIANLRLSEPSMSLSVGTPERMIIEAVAQVIAENQVDINILNGAFDMEAKVGQDLDNMLALFGFGRQIGTKASGFLTLSSDAALNASIRIPAGTQFVAKQANNGIDVPFVSSRSVIMTAGTDRVVVPIEAISSGSSGNVPSNTIKDWNGYPITGITSITNESPIVGGTDQESDEALKARFNATGPFRNLAGTKDQYLALALSTKSKKANVIGPVSKYTEYVQVPSIPDSVDSGPRGGLQTEYTTALSTNVDAKYVYDNLPYHVSDDSGTEVVLYTQDLDFIMNTTPENKNKGDAAREYATGIGIDPEGSEAENVPNVTFTNVYTGNNKGTATISPDDILYFEYSYLSKASRNDYLRGISNCVDVYVDNSDPVLASMTVARPGNGVPVKKFNNDDPFSPLYFKNFRRKESFQSHPVPGHIYVPVLKQPLMDLPGTITTGNGTFIKNVHYWAIEDTTDIKGTIRARNGIEWATNIRAKAGADLEEGPFTGGYITDYSARSGVLSLGIGNTSNWAIVQFADENTFPEHGTLIIETENILYKTNSDVADATPYDWEQITETNGIKYASTTITAEISAAETGTITVASGAGEQFQSSGGYLIIDDEIIQYTSITTGLTGDTLSIATSGRGINGTEITAHKNGATISSFIIYDDAAYKCITSRKWDNPTFTKTAVSGAKNATTIQVPAAPSLTPYTANMVVSGTNVADGTEIIYVDDAGTTLEISQPLEDDVTGDTLTFVLQDVISETPDIDLTNWVKIGNKLTLLSRGVNGTIAASHISGAGAFTPYDALDHTLSIENYIYNGNVVTLQSALESAKQVTTDVLAHEARIRYFKPDITVMYTEHSTPSEINQSIVNSLKSYFDNQYFGSVIQMSDVLQVVRNTPGVDNVRWSKEVLDEAFLTVDPETNNPRDRIIEVNKYGHNAKVNLQRFTIGNGSVGGNVPTQYLFYMSETTKNGTLQLSYNGDIYDIDFYNSELVDSEGRQITEQFNDVTVAITDDNALTTSTIESKISNFASVTASNPDLPPTADNPYTIVYNDVSDVKPLSVVNPETIIEETWTHNEDFLLGDDELASLPEQSDANDITALVTIRARAQNTWNKI